MSLRDPRPCIKHEYKHDEIQCPAIEQILRLATPEADSVERNFTELDKTIDDIMLFPATWNMNDYVVARDSIKSLITKERQETRIDTLEEVSKVIADLEAVATEGGRNVSKGEIKKWLDYELGRNKR